MSKLLEQLDAKASQLGYSRVISPRTAEFIEPADRAEWKLNVRWHSSNMDYWFTSSVVLRGRSNVTIVDGIQDSVYLAKSLYDEEYTSRQWEMIREEWLND